MAVIAVNAPQARVEREDQVLAAIEGLPQASSVTLMTHGYRYSPFHAETCPHRRLFSTKTRKSSWKSISWAHYLRLDQHGLGIGFGWPGTGRLDQAASQAFVAGEAMGGLIAMIHRERPDLRINLIAHSLGVRVALRALSDQRANSVETLVLLSGAEFRDAATRAALSPAGQTARILNVTSGENLAFDALFRLFAPSKHAFAPAVSAGLRLPRSRWLDLKIDDPAHLNALRSLGYRPAAPGHRICHWSSFLRPGLFPLYRDLLGAHGAASFARLTNALPARRKAVGISAYLTAWQGHTARP